MANEKYIPKQPIDKQDLDILMSSYGNMVELNTLIAEQLKQIIEMEKNILSKQDNITTKQKATCEALTNLLSKLNDLALTFKEMKPNLTEGHEDILEKLSVIKDKISSHELETVKNDSKISTKIYIAWGLTGTIVLSLITMIITISSKYGKLEPIYNLIVAIAKQMGIVITSGG